MTDAAMVYALGGHETGPLTPTELRTLAGEMEGSLIDGECQFNHPDWRYVVGLYALANEEERRNAGLDEAMKRIRREIAQESVDRPRFSEQEPT